MCASCNGFCQRVTGLLTLCHCPATTLHAVSFVSCSGVITAGRPPERFSTSLQKFVTAVEGVTAAFHGLAAVCQRLLAGPMVTAEQCSPAAQGLWQLLESSSCREDADRITAAENQEQTGFVPV